MKSSIRVFYYAREVVIDKFTFSAGELQVRVKETKTIDTVEPFIINAHLYDSEGIITLMLVHDALAQQYPKIKQRIIIPYLPYSRQDRVCAPGEAFSLDVLARILNSMNQDVIEGIYTYDVHSKVALHRTLNLNNVTAEKFVSQIPNIENYTHIVSADAGGLQRARLCADLLDLPLLVGKKQRNPDNGEITGTTVYRAGRGVLSTSMEFPIDKPIYGNFLIVDDICDGGRTFVELAKVLRRDVLEYWGSTIGLYVTHGIFSKGLNVFDNLIDRVYSAHVFPNEHDVSSVVIVGK